MEILNFYGVMVKTNVLPGSVAYVIGAKSYQEQNCMQIQQIAITSVQLMDDHRLI